METRHFILSLLYLMPLFNSCVSKSTKPNIVLIIADDLGWDDVGFHGSREALTPHLDYLASRGVILMDYYVNPICTPTRSALMTGRYPIRNGMQSSVIMTHQKWGLGLDQKLLPQFLKDLGYQNHLVGKWHLGFFAKEYTPLKRGFDSFFGCYAGRGDYWTHQSESETLIGLDLRDGDEPVRDKEGNYSTTMFTDVAVGIIERHERNKPLFLVVSYQAVHSANTAEAMQAPSFEISKYADKVQFIPRRKYLGMVSSMDSGVGEIYKALKANNLLHNTIIVFTTDNGGAANGFDLNNGSNFPLRGMKANLYEGGVRGTAFINSPLIEKKGRVSHDLMHVTDLFSTLLHVAGGERPHYSDGYNMWPTISKGKKSPRPEVLLNIDDNIYNDFAIRLGNWKLIKEDDSDFTSWYNPPDHKRSAYGELPFKRRFFNSTIKCKGRIPSHTKDCSKICLFHLKHDPCEMHDLSEKHPHVFNMLKGKIEHYRSRTVEALYDDKEDERADPKYHDGVWSPWVELSNALVNDQ